MAKKPDRDLGQSIENKRITVRRNRTTCPSRSIPSSLDVQTDIDGWSHPPLTSQRNRRQKRVQPVMGTNMGENIASAVSSSDSLTRNFDFVLRFLPRCGSSRETNVSHVHSSSAFFSPRAFRSLREQATSFLQIVDASFHSLSFVTGGMLAVTRRRRRRAKLFVSRPQLLPLWSSRSSDSA